MPLKLFECVLLACVLLYAGRDLRARTARRPGRSPGVIHRTGRVAVMASKVRAELGLRAARVRPAPAPAVRRASRRLVQGRRAPVKVRVGEARVSEVRGMQVRAMQVRAGQVRGMQVRASETLPDTALDGQVTHHPADKRPIVARYPRDVGNRRDEPLGRLAVGGEIVSTPEQVIVDPSDVRRGRVDAARCPVLFGHLLDLLPA